MSTLPTTNLRPPRLAQQTAQPPAPARFVGRLARLGIATDRLVCPIGLPGIEGKEPAVVAVSVAAQLMQVSPMRQGAAPVLNVQQSCGDCVCPSVVSRVPG